MTITPISAAELVAKGRAAGGEEDPYRKQIPVPRGPYDLEAALAGLPRAVGVASGDSYQNKMSGAGALTLSYGTRKVEPIGGARARLYNAYGRIEPSAVKGQIIDVSVGRSLAGYMGSGHYKKTG